VFFRFELGWIESFSYDVPIRFRHDQARLVSLLQILGSVEAIVMSVSQDHIFDLSRIQMQFLQSVRYQLFHAVVIAGVDENDSVRSRHRPSGLERAPDVIEVIECLSRLRAPFSAWSLFRRPRLGDGLN